MADNIIQDKSSLSFGEWLRKNSKDYAIIIAIVLLMLIFSLASPYFLKVNNLMNILMQSSTLAIVASGAALVILTGEFDLSLGQVACVTSCVAAYMMKICNISPFIAILTALVLGLIIGAINGLMVAYARIPAFIATLGVQFIAKGSAKVITQAAPIAKLPKSTAFLGRGDIAGIPIAVCIMILVYIIFSFFTKNTKYGRYIYSIGGNNEAAFFAGIDVKFYKMTSFAIAGFMAAFGGIILMSRLDSAFITNGNLYEFDAIISSVIGGLSLTGGKGKIIGAMFGAVFLTMFFNGMTILNVDPFYQDILKGLVLIVAIGIDVIRNRKSYA